eukprot:2569704-Pyramimonas_sp.AAC.1
MLEAVPPPFFPVSHCALKSPATRSLLPASLELTIPVFTSSQAPKRSSKEYPARGKYTTTMMHRVPPMFISTARTRPK